MPALTKKKKLKYPKPEGRDYIPGDPKGHWRVKGSKVDAKPKTAEEKRLLAHKEMTKDEAYMSPKKLAEKKRHKAKKEMTKDEAYSDPTPGHGRHPPSASGKPVQRETKPIVKSSQGAVKGGNGKVTWSGGKLSPQEMKKRRESRRRGGRAGYSGGGIALRGFGATRKK